MAKTAKDKKDKISFTVSVSGGLYKILHDLAVREKRSLKAQAEMIIEEFFRKSL